MFWKVLQAVQVAATGIEYSPVIEKIERLGFLAILQDSFAALFMQIYRILLQHYRKDLEDTPICWCIVLSTASV